MYLHKDKENFKNIIEQVSNKTRKPTVVIEKDYYVTLILRKLAMQLDNVVFKGGTSLSKGYHAIDRFSEDIDITFNEHIGESRRKKLKNVILKGISKELEMPILNFNQTQSDRNYNAYLFSYHSVFDFEDDPMPRYVKLETALGSYSFPTEVIEITNFIGSYMKDIAIEYELDPFLMQLQTIERTFIDKVFALCNYYLEGKSKRYSRHLYDIYKLTPLIKFDEKFTHLIHEVREHRAQMTVCPSAKKEISISNLVKKFCDNNFYEEDYHSITNYFTDDYISYEDVIENIRNIINYNLF